MARKTENRKPEDVPLSARHGPVETVGLVRDGSSFFVLKSYRFSEAARNLERVSSVAVSSAVASGHDKLRRRTEQKDNWKPLSARTKIDLVVIMSAA